MKFVRERKRRQRKEGKEKKGAGVDAGDRGLFI
jgi:hypothetical protein